MLHQQRIYGGLYINLYDCKMCKEVMYILHQCHFYDDEVYFCGYAVCENELPDYQGLLNKGRLWVTVS